MPQYFLCRGLYAYWPRFMWFKSCPSHIFKNESTIQVGLFFLWSFQCVKQPGNFLTAFRQLGISSTEHFKSLPICSIPGSLIFLTVSVQSKCKVNASSTVLLPILRFKKSKMFWNINWVQSCLKRFNPQIEPYCGIFQDLRANNQHKKKGLLAQSSSCHGIARQGCQVSNY